MSLFNVFPDDVRDWGIEALHRAIEGLRCTTAVHICYGYGIEANIRWKQTLGAEWRQYEEIFPALNASRIAQVSLECANSRVPLSLLGLLSDKEILLGAIDVASPRSRRPTRWRTSSARPWPTWMPSASCPAPTAAWRRCRVRWRSAS